MTASLEQLNRQNVPLNTFNTHRHAYHSVESMSNSTKKSFLLVYSQLEQNIQTLPSQKSHRSNHHPQKGIHVYSSHFKMK
jgi:hypothetical protein